MAGEGNAVDMSLTANEVFSQAVEGGFAFGQHIGSIRLVEAEQGISREVNALNLRRCHNGLRNRRFFGTPAVVHVTGGGLAAQTGSQCGEEEGFCNLIHCIQSLLGLPENCSFKLFQVAFAASNAYFQVYLKPTLPR